MPQNHEDRARHWDSSSTNYKLRKSLQQYQDPAFHAETWPVNWNSPKSWFLELDCRRDKDKFYMKGNPCFVDNSAEVPIHVAFDPLCASYAAQQSSSSLGLASTLGWIWWSSHVHVLIELRSFDWISALLSWQS